SSRPRTRRTAPAAPSRGRPAQGTRRAGGGQRSGDASWWTPEGNHKGHKEHKEHNTRYSRRQPPHLEPTPGLPLSFFVLFVSFVVDSSLLEQLRCELAQVLL